MLNTQSLASALLRLSEEDAIGQLRRREGLMALLGSENGTPMLDWVEGVARLLAADAQLEAVVAEARALWDGGIRHIIWAGMGGSIMAVRVLLDMGYCNGPPEQQVTIYPLDSTDPADLNSIMRRIAAQKALTLPPRGQTLQPLFLYALLADVMMIGVSMGMTSEEPITHLEWFSQLLAQAQLVAADHLFVMTLPGSYLDAFARERQVPSRPLQLDGGTGTGGRMSAPCTRVFLLPVALHLTRCASEPGHGNSGTSQLRAILRQAWHMYDLSLAAAQPGAARFARLAAALSAASVDGVCRMMLSLPDEWRPMLPWIEQLLEESLGKGGKGVLVFDEQQLNTGAPCYREEGMLKVQVVARQASAESDRAAIDTLFTLFLPEYGPGTAQQRLSALAATFLGWQLTMALYGYLHAIPFAGQPAVENYKARTRLLRAKGDPLDSIAQWSARAQNGPLLLLAPGGLEIHTVDEPAELFARTLRQFAPENRRARLDYLDLTINGHVSVELAARIKALFHRIGNTMLGVPVKVRQAPAAYHSTEQSEMDGSPSVVSLRLLVRDSEETLLGSYSNTLLQAQAISTWQAMIEQGRQCFLLLAVCSALDVYEPMLRFFQDVERMLL